MVGLGPGVRAGVRWSFAIAVSFLALGCAGPRYVPPTVEKPAGPLSLQAAVELAFRNNPDLAAAEQKVVAAQAAIDDAMSDYWPVLQFSESFYQTDTPSQAFGIILDQKKFKNTIDFNDPGVTSNWQTAFTGSVTLFDGGRRRYRVLRRNAEANSTAAQAERARRDLALEVARAYYTIHKARETAGTQEQSISTLNSHLRITKDRQAEGAARRSEVLAVEVRLAETREAAIVARNSASRAEAGLRLLLGLDMGDPLELLSPQVTEAPPQENYGDLVQRAQRSRLELFQAVEQVKAAAARVQETEAGYFPEITLFGGFRFDDRHPFDFQYGNWFWGASFLQSVVEIFRTPIRVREAMAQWVAACAAARKTLLEVELDVKDSLLDAEVADARHEVAAQAAALAAESLRLVEAEYQEGTATITRLLDAELALTQARTRLSATTYDRSLSRIAILHAVGEYPPPSAGQRETSTDPQEEKA